MQNERQRELDGIEVSEHEIRQAHMEVEVPVNPRKKQLIGEIDVL